MLLVNMLVYQRPDVLVTLLVYQRPETFRKHVGVPEARNF